MKRIILLFLISRCLACCQSGDHPTNKFSDAARLKIADLQDRRLSDSLYPYFNHQNPLYRKDAVLAFGSIQDPDAADKIGRLLLLDSDTAVRKAAAFAMGQVQSPSSERILLGAIVKEKDPWILRELLESYGKLAKKWQLDETALLNDSTKTAGLAWSIYRAGLRGKTDSIANQVAIGLLDQKHPPLIRMGAAQYFSRGAKDFEFAGNALIHSSTHDPVANVRMAAALALGKIPGDESLAALKDIFYGDHHGGVVVSAVRALTGFPHHLVKNYLYEALHHQDVNVGIAASESIIETVQPENWIEVSTLTNEIENWRIKANVYQAALKGGQNKGLAEEIQTFFENATDGYEKAAFLGALSHYPEAFQYVANALTTTDAALVRSAAASTLVAMRYSRNFRQELEPEFAALFSNLIQSDDPAVSGIIAGALSDTTFGFRNLIKDISFLYEARKKLRLPKDYEALQSIQAAIAHFKHLETPRLVNEFNHPINWELVKTIDKDQLATITTTRGSMVIKLLVNESPGSVANFVELVQKDYFDDKYIHRVVPNFVIQGGCRRGDGWGSEDYSIRSEFSPRRFKAGSVGMASAGKDTEGTQWFITHSPTPHLDGRYTIFAEVQEGMKVVEYLQVGDKILDIVLEGSPSE